MNLVKVFTSLTTLAIPTAIAATPEAVMRPQEWSAVEQIYVHGDIPEVQGITTTASFPISDYQPEQVIGNALSLLQPQESWSLAVMLSVIGVIILFGIFTIVNGSVKLNNGFSGNKVLRWSKADVAIHWLGGISCMVLIISGIVIASGKFLIEPSLTDSRWLGIINSAINWHALLALPFIAGYVLMVIKWASKQAPKAYDLKWFASLGGYLNFGSFKGKHPDAGFANAGEKLWFWTFAIFGFMISVSGLVLMYPESITVSKDTANWMLVGHLISAIVIGAFSVVHIFMATVISEGGMENMVSGYCDENWAKQHHNLWYQEVK